MTFSLKAWRSVTFYSSLITTTYVYVCECTYIIVWIYKYKYVYPCTHIYIFHILTTCYDEYTSINITLKD